MIAPATDVSSASLVEEAFGEMECCSGQPSPHGGPPVAYMIFHDCSQGMVCQAHYQRALDVLIPGEWAEHLSGRGFLYCTHCYGYFRSLDTWVRYYPL